jgi:hypothetical protein
VKTARVLWRMRRSYARWSGEDAPTLSEEDARWSGGPVAVGFRWGGSMSLVGNFMKRDNDSGSFTRNKHQISKLLDYRNLDL